MKNLIMAAVLLISAHAFAGEIVLQPGQTITLDGDTVSCPGNAKNIPNCRLEGSLANSYYRVYAGDKEMGNGYPNLDRALEVVGKLRSLEICR